MPLNAGALDRVITVQTATKTTDGSSGEEVSSWDDVAEQNVSAQWLPASSREAWQAGQRIAAYIEGVFVVYDMSPRPTPGTTRIFWEEDGRTFDIKGVEEIGRRDGLKLFVTARADT